MGEMGDEWMGDEIIRWTLSNRTKIGKKNIEIDKNIGVG